MVLWLGAFDGPQGRLLCKKDGRLDQDKRVPFYRSERQRAEKALQRQAVLLEGTSDLIRACEPSELSRVTFEHIRSDLGAVLCAPTIASILRGSA